MTTEAGVEIRRGLKGVYIDITESSYIDGTAGKLLYRGYNIHDLAEHASFEEVIYLLLYGRLPTRAELEELDGFLKANRAIPQPVYRIIEMTKDARPMDVLRTGVSALAAFDPDTGDNSEDAIIRKGLRLTSQATAIVCAHHRIRKGLEPVQPHRSLSHAGNFLYMLTGQLPDPEEEHLMNVDFVVHAEHGANASAFAARVAASTLADLHSAVVAGIAALKGPLHGGAAESVMKMALEIGGPERVEEYVHRVVGSGGRIMGFGHRVYKSEDPRGQHLRERARALSLKRGHPQWFQILERVEEAMRPFQSRGIYPNLDFYAGSIYHLLNIPEDLFVPIFALGRIPGWTLQVLEQYRNNVLIRPLLHYTGPMDLEYVPLEHRS